jgi:GNAT superfamily N-acetyltransferase
MTVVTARKISIERLSPESQPLLEKMYDSFAPLGAAFGLPPVEAGRRRAWLADIGKGINLMAFIDGVPAGHLVLLPLGRVAEMAVFVHQDFRRQGVATALAEAAVREARAAGQSAISVFIDSSNEVARRGLIKFGFRAAWEDLQEAQYVYPLRREGSAR